MKYKRFYFHVGYEHFPGYSVTQPFYLDVEYEYTSKGKFSRVMNVEISFQAISVLKLSNSLALEIEEAARNNILQTWNKNEDDIPPALFTQKETSDDYKGPL